MLINNTWCCHTHIDHCCFSFQTSIGIHYFSESRAHHYFVYVCLHCVLLVELLLFSFHIQDKSLGNVPLLERKALEERVRESTGNHCQPRKSNRKQRLMRIVVKIKGKRKRSQDSKKSVQVQNNVQDAN